MGGLKNNRRLVTVLGNLHGDFVDQNASGAGTTIHRSHNIAKVINRMAEQQFVQGIAQEFLAVFFALTILVSRSIALAHLDFAIDDRTIRHSFQVRVDHNLVPAGPVQDLDVLDAVMTNINTDRLAHAADF